MLRVVGGSGGGGLNEELVALLRKTADQIESGETPVDAYGLFYEQDTGGGMQFNGNLAYVISFCELLKARAIAEWWK